MNYRAVSLFALATGLLTGAAQAQDTAAAVEPGPQQSPEYTQSDEPIVVVGSQIRGARETGALPVTVLGPEEIAATGAVSGEELFRSLPQAGDVTFNTTWLGGGNANAARGDVSTVSLRGLAQGNTLVLLNGRRVVVHPTSQQDTVPVFGYNINAIPLSGLARIEVLKEGAAALYGSDAVAGVVNNVLQSDFEGLDIDAQYGGAESTNLREGQVNLHWGSNVGQGRGNVSVFMGYTDRTSLLKSDQPFTATDDRRSLIDDPAFADSPAFDGRSTSSAWGGFQVLGGAPVAAGGQPVTNASGQFHVQPITNGGCTYTLGNGLCLAPGTLTGNADRNLRQDAALSFPDTTVIPSIKRFNALLFANYDLTPSLAAFAELGYYTARSRSVVGAAGSLSHTPITVPAGNYWNPFGPVLLPDGTPNPNRLPGLSISPDGVPVTILNYNYADAGSREVEVENDQYRILGGLRGDVLGIDWESAVLYNEATVDDTSDGLSSALIQRALDVSTPDAYNIFNGGNLAAPSIGDATPNPASITDPFRIRNTRANKATLFLADLKFSSTDVFTIPGGGVGVAAGVEFRRETYRDNRDARQDTSLGYVDAVTGIRYGSDLVGHSPSPDVSGKRSVYSAYAELAIPVISEDMGIPLVRSVDVQLAGRFEDYSDVGSVAKPKIAGAWDVFDGLRLRGSWSQGFRAPNLEVLNIPQLERSFGSQDFVLCEADLRAGRIADFSRCARNIGVTQIQAGNPDLKPEESESLSYGVVFEPAFIPPGWGSLILTLDRWRIQQEGVIGSFGYQNALALDYLLRTQGSSNPRVVRDTPTAEDIAIAAGTGLAPIGRLLYVDDSFQNLLPLDIRGIDFGVNYALRGTALGNFNLNLNVAYLEQYFQSPPPEVQILLDARDAGAINAGTPVTGASELVRQDGKPEWRWSANLTWATGPWQVGAFTQYIGSVEQTTVRDAEGNPWVVDSQLTANLYVQYTFDGGWRPLEGTQVRIGARNITDEKPPLASGGYLGNLYIPYARYWYAGISRTF